MFAETILYQSGLDAKIVDPGRVRDSDPGPARAIPKGPARDASLALRGRRPPRFPSAAALADPANRGAALHFFANHELLALELMALVLLRFPHAPPAFRLSLVATMRDEQRHLQLYLNRMADHDVQLGDHGVSAFFWDALADARSPAAFAAGMGLTLEQANLDFASHFERAFRAVGDPVTAAILQTVRADEIGHLRQGRQWFDKLSGASSLTADATLFDRWSDALVAPLTPARGRGVDFDLEGRVAAGLPPEFIERVRLARHSKGRPPVVHTFEPACELQIAHGRAGLVLPRPIVQLGRDLEALPVAWAHADDVVLVREVPKLTVQQRWLEAGLAVPEFVPTPLDTPDLPADHPLRGRALGDLRPWGWSPDAIERLSPCVQQLVTSPGWLQRTATRSENQPNCAPHAVDEPAPKAVESAPQSIDSIAALGHHDRQVLFRKDHWPAVHRSWEAGPHGMGSPVAEVSRTRRQALDAVDRLHGAGQDAVLKAPLGTAGRGAIRVLCAEGEMTKGQRRWLDRCLGQQGAVVVMPWLDRVVDVSVQLRVEPDGRIRVLGVTRFLTDGRGQYMGTVLGRATWGLPPEVQAFWHGARRGGRSVDPHVKDSRSMNVPKTLHAMALHVGAALAKTGFAGVAGVDALVYRSGDGALALHPLLEVNPRMTLGHVGLALERRLAPGRSGVLLLVGQRELRQSESVGFAALVERLAAALPMDKSTAGLRSGVVPLADPTTVESALALWLAAPTGAALKTALATCGLGLPWAGCWGLAGAG